MAHKRPKGPKIKVFEHSDGLKVHRIPGWHSNKYILEHPDGHLAIVDLGYPQETRDVVDYAAGELGGNVQEVFLTHSHKDHVGDWRRITRAFPNATIAASERMAGFQRGEHRATLRRHWPRIAWFTLRTGGFDWNTLRTVINIPSKPNLRIGRYYKDGDALKSFPLELISAPGHTPHCVVLLGRGREGKEGKEGILFSGDVLRSRGGLILPTRWATDREQHLETVRQLSREFVEKFWGYKGSR
jgi:glyoxylase-like metal-dependent hydrolase (beta-lactamase superfamily II)